MQKIKKITIESNFIKPKTIKEAKKALSTLADCPEVLIDVFVQGHFEIVGRAPMNSELDLDYGWYKVTKIGQKNLTVYVNGDGRSYNVKPKRWGFDRRPPGFRLVADVFNTLSFRYDH